MHSLQLYPYEKTLGAPSIHDVAWLAPWYHGDDAEALAMFGKIRPTDKESTGVTFGPRFDPYKRNDFSAS